MQSAIGKYAAGAVAALIALAGCLNRDRDTRSAAIKQMGTWLKQWYDTEPSKEQQALVIADMQNMMTRPIASQKMLRQGQQ